MGIVKKMMILHATQNAFRKVLWCSDFIIKYTTDELMSPFDIKFFVNIGHVLFYGRRANKQGVADFIDVHAFY